MDFRSSHGLQVGEWRVQRVLSKSPRRTDKDDLVSEEFSVVIFLLPAFRREHFPDEFGFERMVCGGAVAEKPPVKPERDEVGQAKLAQRPRCNRFENGFLRNDVIHLSSAPAETRPS